METNKRVTGNRVKTLTSEMQVLSQENSLTAYEAKVVGSLIDFVLNRGYLTEKQVTLFENIKSNYAPELLKERQEWAHSFDSRMNEDIRLVMGYYLTHGQYFYALAQKVKEDENYIPTEKVYHKVTGNKYAQRVLNEHHKEPRFQTGEMVFCVSKAPSKEKYDLPRGGIILRPNAEPVINSVKGAKRYLVLPIGNPHGIVVEERWLKTRRDVKNGDLGKAKKRQP